MHLANKPDSIRVFGCDTPHKCHQTKRTQYEKWTNLQNTGTNRDQKEPEKKKMHTEREKEKVVDFSNKFVFRMCTMCGIKVLNWFNFATATGNFFQLVIIVGRTTQMTRFDYYSIFHSKQKWEIFLLSFARVPQWHSGTFFLSKYIQTEMAAALDPLNKTNHHNLIQC